MAFELKISEDDPGVAYLRLPISSPGCPRKAAKQIRLSDLIGKYEGPDLYFDFAQNGVLLGIEILADLHEEDRDCRSADCEDGNETF